MTKKEDSSTFPLKRFKHKFVLSTMVYAAIAMVALVSIMAFWNFHTQEQTVYDALEHNVMSTKGPNAAQEEIRIENFGDEASETNVTAPPSSNEQDQDSEQPLLGSGDEQMRPSGNDPFVASSTYIINEDGEVAVVNDSLSLGQDVSQQAITEALDQANKAQSTQTDQKASAHGAIPALNLYHCTRLNSDGSATVSLASDNFVRHSMFTQLRVLIPSCILLLIGLFGLSLLMARWAVQPVARAWKQQSQFIADASHELKTPLTVILANNSLLSSDPEASPEERALWIESIESEGHLMQNLVNDMLYLARSDAEDEHLTYGEVDFSELVMEQALQFEAVAFENGLMLEEDIEEGICLHGDPARLQRLSAILIDNACKYAETGTSVNVSLHKGAQECVLKVQNRGPVIDPEDLPHIFDRFYRSDKARTRETGGFGLGLAIAKSVCDDLGGSIHATSNETAGTIFTARLPLN